MKYRFQTQNYGRRNLNDNYRITFPTQTYTAVWNTCLQRVQNILCQTYEATHD